MEGERKTASVKYSNYFCILQKPRKVTLGLYGIPVFYVQVSVLYSHIYRIDFFLKTDIMAVKDYSSIFFSVLIKKTTEFKLFMEGTKITYWKAVK